jgi:predicted DNA-binding transcriptional regulator AlpA
MQVQDEALATDELITDSEVQRLLRVGQTKLFELQKAADFPPPIWLGPRLKRHRRSAVLRWALSKLDKPADVEPAR